MGICAGAMLSLAACQQPQQPAVIENDIMACRNQPSKHSQQFCKRVEEAFRLYMGAAETDSGQSAPAALDRANPKAARPRRPVHDQPITTDQVGANPFQAQVASVLIAESFINDQLRKNLRTELVQNLRVQLDPDGKRIFLQGLLQVPLEEMRAINLDPDQGAFRFQISMRPLTTPQGFLILQFPLNESYFYPARSKGLESDRVIVPVQLLSLGIASVRSYLAALSGDFSGFDRRTARIRAVIQSLEKARASQTNPDARDELSNQIASHRLQLEAVPIERKQLENMSRDIGPLVSFLSRKELDLNQVLQAHKNALVLQVRLSDLFPFLRDVDLGGVRMVRNNTDGQGDNFLALDANASLAKVTAATDTWLLQRSQEPLPKTPALVVRLNQALFASTALIETEQKTMGEKISDLDIQMRDDGLHVSGRYRGLGVPVPFDAIVELKTVQTDVFEARVRGLELAGVDVPFLTGFVLHLLRDGLDQSLEGGCTFEDIPKTDASAQALRVHVGVRKDGSAAALVPAFPDLHLIRIDVREREFLLKLGRLEKASQ